MTEYSASELKLIGCISPHWLSIIQDDKNGDINPVSIYRILVEKVFIKDKRGPEIEALRRIIKAIKNYSPTRPTPEFDKLCEF
jgi:hypothetical protein